MEFGAEFGVEFGDQNWGFRLKDNTYIGLIHSINELLELDRSGRVRNRQGISGSLAMYPAILRVGCRVCYIGENNTKLCKPRLTEMSFQPVSSPSFWNSLTVRSWELNKTSIW